MKEEAIDYSNGPGDKVVQAKSATVDILPLEILDLIVEQLSGGGPTSIMDYYNCVKALGRFSPATCDCLKKKVSIFAPSVNESEFVRTLGNRDNALREGNEVPVGTSHLLLHVDERWLATEDRQFISLADESTQVSVVINVKAGLVSFLRLGKLLRYKFPTIGTFHHVLMECDFDTLDCHEERLDIFKEEYYPRGDLLFGHLTILNVETLRMRDDELHEFVKLTPARPIEYAPSIANFLQVNVHMPSLKSLVFVNDKNETSWNKISLTREQFHILNLKDVRLAEYFSVHSLRNWDLPKLRYFSGHELLFNECKNSCEGCRSRFQRSAAMMGNLRLLRDIAIRENPDGLSHFNVSLVPEGVLETSIINWIPFDGAQHEQAIAPPFCIHQETLRKLHLGIINCKRGGTLRAEGLYMPKLKELDISFSGWCPTHCNPEELCMFTFSTWNNLPECRSLTFTDNSSFGPNVVITVDGAAAILPKLVECEGSSRPTYPPRILVI